MANNLADSTAQKDKKSTQLKSKVIYRAEDSIRFDVVNQKVYLFGNGEIDYETIKLKAAYIELDLRSNTLFARGITDSTGKESGLPNFSDKGDSFDAKTIRYNFESKRGKIEQILTQEGEGYIHGSTVKKDSTDVFYIKDGKYTTCNHTGDPHFYIKASKLKVIQNDKIITGPAYLVIEEVPTPLAVPFGLFPNKRGRRSGIIIPAYGESVALGFFLRDGGYYFGLNDYFDLSLKGDIYSMGSWRIGAGTSYKKRYKFSGNLDLSYSNILTGDVDANPNIQKDFFVRWTHAQDPKSKPNSRFLANVNAGSSSYNLFNTYNPGQYLRNTFQSNIAYSKSFPGTPFNMTLNARHSQNTITKQVDLSAPEFTWNMNRIYPVKMLTKKKIGARWYDKIGLSWQTNARNDITRPDSLLFEEETLKLMKNGIRHTVPLSTSFNLKYFTLSPTISGTSRWYFQEIEKRWDTANDSLITDTIQGFSMANDYSFSASLSTRLYGHYSFLDPTKMKVRHVITPSINFSYRPDFSEDKFAYYKEVQADTLGNIQSYSRFQNGIYGGPASGKSGMVSGSINNNLEMKVRSAKDTVDGYKKIMLVESFTVSSGYNLAAETFNWSNINMNGRTKLFKKLIINLNGTFDPYAINSEGQRVDSIYTWRANRQIGRLTSSVLSFSTNLRGGKKKEGKRKSAYATQEELDFINAYPDAYVDFNIPWSLNLYYNLRYSKPAWEETITQTLTFSGDVSLTPNWKVGFNSGYDFLVKELTYTSLNIYRNLHCWEMQMNWIPFGRNQRYSIDIKVKASVLQDLKLSRKREWYDYQ